MELIAGLAIGLCVFGFLGLYVATSRPPDQPSPDPEHAVLPRGGPWGLQRHLDHSLLGCDCRTVSRHLEASAMRRGFTLVELLIVITIILIISVLALPVVIPAVQHRQVSEAARFVQSALAGARDDALRTGAPSGIRLLPDPAFPLVYLPNGQIDPTQPLAANRIVPIAAAPEYTEGMASVVIPNSLDGTTNAYSLAMPYPLANGGGFYPWGAHSVLFGNTTTTGNVLMIKEQAIYLNSQGTPTLNSPTSWFWNIRLGDKIQLNGAGPWFTVVGPMTLTAQDGNSELFVNAGAPATASPLTDTQAGAAVSPEFIFLVNGIDDNKNGWTDEGYDGLDNNLAQEAIAGTAVLADDLFEWETEAWPTAFNSKPPTNVPYTIQRRAAPVSNSREVSLPANVVIDLTTWGSTRERSRLPVNPITGYVDILLNPNGTVVSTTIYSSPSSFGMDSGLFHFWVAERSDVASPIAATPSLPIGSTIPPPQGQSRVFYTGPTIQGEYQLVTLTAKTGGIATRATPEFDNPAQPFNQVSYQAGIPFLFGR